MVIAYEFLQGHDLIISQTKSKIMSSDALSGDTIFTDQTDTPLITLDQVISFKYLGVAISCAPYQMFRVYSSEVKRKAAAYLRRVLSISRKGPDRAKLFTFSHWYYQRVGICGRATTSIIAGVPKKEEE